MQAEHNVAAILPKLVTILARGLRLGEEIHHSAHKITLAMKDEA